MSFLRRTDVFMESMSPARESAPPFSGYGATSQGFGAVGDPSSAARAPAAAAAPRANSGPHTPGPHPLSPARRSGLAFVGHPQHQHHLNPIISSPADSSTADNFLRPPPVSGTGTGSGPGSRSGLGFGTNAPGSARRAVSAAVSYGNPYPQHQDASPAALAPSSATSPSRARRPQSSTYRSVSFAPRGQYSPTRASHHQDRRAPAHPNALVPGLRTPTGSGAGSDTGPALTLGARPMFDLPSIPTSTDDFASIPYLNPDTSSASASTAPKDTMSQPPQQQQQYAAAQRRTTGYGEEQQQHHMQGSGQYQQHGPMSPRDYPAPAGGPHITLDQAPGSSSYQGTPSSYTSGSAVPSVLQPGGALARPPATNATSSLLQGSTQQQQDYQTPGRPSLSMSHNHSYSRSSPSAGYDAPNPGFSPYTPTTPSGPGSSSAQFMSPTDRNYNAPGSQRNMSHTPLGLADIRPRADSSLSDGMPSGLDFHSQNAPPGPSNYMAPWTSYAFDWCKWAPQGNGAGKVAIGSYLEDGHNFVSSVVLRGGVKGTTGSGGLVQRADVLIADSNSRYPNRSYPSRRLQYPRRLQVDDGLHQGRRGYTLLSRDTAALGAALDHQAIHRSACNIRGPSKTVVIALRDNGGDSRQLDNKPQPRSGDDQAYAPSTLVQLENSRSYRTFDLARLEHSLSVPHHHFQHRYDLYDLGHTFPDGQNPAHRTR